MSFDYKDWIINRYEELASEKYGDNLPTDTDMELWDRAERDWTDHYSAMIDAAYERARDAQLFSQSDGD